MIKPSEISARILTMLEESDVSVIIVSPYIKIAKWYKLINKINELKSRRIPTEIYVRDDPDNLATYRDLDRLALAYQKIPNLHSKFYLNERYGIITSMNLLLSSEINSLEIGYATETWTEYNELVHFYNRYIRTGEPVHCELVADQQLADPRIIKNRIQEELNKAAKNSWSWLSANVLHISTGRNNYSILIYKSYMRITASIKTTSGAKQQNIQNPTLIMNKIRDLTSMQVEIYPCHIPGLMHFKGQALHKLKSICITRLLEAEAAYIIESICGFIDVTENLI